MISNTTQAILALADTLPGGREAFLAEIALEESESDKERDL